MLTAGRSVHAHSPKWLAPLNLQAIAFGRSNLPSGNIAEPPLKELLCLQEDLTGDARENFEKLLCDFPVVLAVQAPEDNHGYLHAHHDSESCKNNAYDRTYDLEGFYPLEQGGPALEDVTPLMVSDEWEAAISSCLYGMKEREERKLAVCGSKGVGKSTLMKLVINKLLSDTEVDRVCLIDCDAGQPELGPPGLVSMSLIHEPLLGPPYLHAFNPSSCYFIGDVTSKSDPVMYIASIQALIARYEEEFADVPLVVNMDGWVKGLGESVLQNVLMAINPNHVIKIQGTRR